VPAGDAALELLGAALGHDPAVIEDRDPGGEVIRLVQEARKGQGFEVSDRIELWWSAADEETAAALREGEATLAAEVLAVTCREEKPHAPLAPHEEPELGLTFWLRVVD